MSFAFNDFVEGMLLKLLDSMVSTTDMYSPTYDGFTLFLDHNAIVSINKDRIAYYKVTDDWKLVAGTAYELLDKEKTYNVYCAFKAKLGG